jgi:hypothetical protein
VLQNNNSCSLVPGQASIEEFLIRSIFSWPYSFSAACALCARLVKPPLSNMDRRRQRHWRLTAKTGEAQHGREGRPLGNPPPPTHQCRMKQRVTQSTQAEKKHPPASFANPDRRPTVRRRPMLSLTTRALIAASILLTTVLATLFWRGQNKKNKLGGRISRPKIAWLFYAIFLWFFLCPLLALDEAIPAALRIGLGAFALSMWFRGAAEMLMLYVTKNWRPPMGIAHDVSCIALLVGVGIAFRDQLTPLHAIDRWALALYFFVLLSLIVEILYAAMFFKASDGKTTGKEGIWFASADEARFRRINRLTTLLNLPQYAFVAAFLAVCFAA